MNLSGETKSEGEMKTVKKRGMGFVALVIVLEAVFSFFLYLSLAEKVFVVVPAGATAGVPGLISYQGMLTNASGTALNSNGAAYCFAYSIWNSPTVGAGNELWPLQSIGDASNSPQFSTTTVTNGVFSDQLGRVDSLAGLDFVSTSTYYLQVQVETSSPSCTGTFETLSPRQQITSDGWAQTAQSVYGNLLRTVYTSTSTGTVYIGAGTYSATNGIVQIGSGSGGTAGQQTLLSLDEVNAGSENIGTACTQKGTLWYDNTLNHVMVCEGAQMQEISNQSGPPGQFSYWNASGTFLSATSSLYFSSTTGFVGVATSVPQTAFAVAGTSTFAGGVTISGNATNTTAYFSGAVTATGTLGVGGVATFASALDASSTAGFSGAATFAGTATFANTATFNSTISQTAGTAAFLVTTITGHLISAGTTPSKSCTGNITGHDTAGLIGLTAATTSCTVTFSSVFSTNAPACMVEVASGSPVAFKVSSTLTNVVITDASSTAMPIGTTLSYHCFGL
ncbi:MAG: hypothetical protein WCF77_04135 [Minisyncoccia bacterium]